MKKMFKLFAKEENGFIISTEMILIATIAVLGLLAGIVEVRDQVVQELGDFSQAVAQLDQSYEYNGVATSTAGTEEADSTAGGVFNDGSDKQATTDTEAGGINVVVSAAAESDGME